MPDLLESLNRRIDRSDAEGCWLWPGAKSKGYGLVGPNWVGTRRVHRLVWELFYEVQLGSHQHVCHHCDNRACCNIDHLFVGRNVDNMIDAVAKGRHAEARKTHCPYGHPYAGDNLSVLRDGRRACRQCKRNTWHEAHPKVSLTGGEQQSRTGGPSPAAAARPAGIRAGVSDVTRNRLTPRPTIAGDGQ